MNKASVFPGTCLLIIVLICSSLSLYADDRGATETFPGEIFTPAGFSPAIIGQPAQTDQYRHQRYISPWGFGTDDWNLIRHDTMTVAIPTDAPLCVIFDPWDESLEYFDPVTPLSSLQQQALDKAPNWLRADLYDNFIRFDFSMIADWVAEVIIDAPDPYVDEVCFQAAHISPGLLGGSMYLEMLLQNAELIYEIDEALEFVELVDFGTSAGDNYYTTAVYNTIAENGDPQTFAIDRDIYYWYIVHPKLSDELPTYIDPATGDPANPPTGVFWRDYLWNHADSGYTLYSDMWDEDIQYLWDRGDTTGTDAIQTINAWIGNVMNWGAGTERPIQPVRIYALHCGNCGEYQDIQAAAARIALIPAVCTSNICEDHVWNEFWAPDAEEFIHWDGGSINNPLMYENSWGKTLSAVFNYRGDGYVSTVTERYSADVCTLNVTITDSTGKPADGHRIKMYADFYYGGIYYTTWGATNSLGQVTFLLGDGHDYYIRVEGALGSFPASASQQQSIIVDSEPGAVYNWEHSMLDATPALGVAVQEEYPNPLDDYLLEIEYECLYETVYQSFFTINGISTQFSKKESPGVVDFFVCNEANYFPYLTFGDAEGFGITDNSASGFVSFVLPTDDPWYAIFSNREQSVNRPMVNLSVNVYRNSNVAVGNEPDVSIPAEFALEHPYPNPFNSDAVISFAVAETEQVKISVFDVTGREIAKLTDSPYAPGYHTVDWDGVNRNRMPVASGIYFVRMTTPSQQFAQKICLIK